MELVTLIFLAQASSALDAHPLLLAYGPMGAVIVYFMAAGTWFMKKVVAAMNLMVDKIEEGNKEIVEKINETNHRLQGQRYASLLNTVNTNTPNPAYRKMAEEELARLSAAANPHMHQNNHSAS